MGAERDRGVVRREEGVDGADRGGLVRSVGVYIGGAA